MNVVVHRTNYRGAKEVLYAAEGWRARLKCYAFSSYVLISVLSPASYNYLCRRVV